MTYSAETRSMLDILNAGFPRVEQMSGADARAAVRARYQPTPDPEYVSSVSDISIDGPGGALDLRVYQPAGPAEHSRPIVVFAHGGGFVFCDLDTHDGICRSIANSAGAVVISVNYRLAPERPAPAAAHDMYAAVSWASEHSEELSGDRERIVVAGDSAGGNLAAVAALIARDTGLPIAAQVLVYPVIDDNFETASYRTYAEGHFNTRAAMAWYWEQYVPGGVDNAESTTTPEHLAPIRAESLEGLPPAIVITAACDPLDSEGTAYAERLSAAGVPTLHRRYADTFHGFLTIPSLSVTDIARKQLWSDLTDVLELT